jgi:hypothetical protein
MLFRVKRHFKKQPQPHFQTALCKWKRTFGSRLIWLFYNMHSFKTWPGIMIESWVRWVGLGQQKKKNSTSFKSFACGLVFKIRESDSLKKKVVIISPIKLQKLPTIGKHHLLSPAPTSSVKPKTIIHKTTPLKKHQFSFSLILHPQDPYLANVHHFFNLSNLPPSR